MRPHELDSVDRFSTLHDRIHKKRALNLLYLEVYARYQACLSRCPRYGIAVELGAGAGFAREIIPGLTTSDILPYPSIDISFDARAFPFPARFLRAVFMYNVFHHIPDAEAFLREVQRVLMPGGRLFIVDEFSGFISTPVRRYLHHEGYDPAAGWSFESSGPLSGANGALCWIVFERDRTLFGQRYPNLEIVRYEPHTPLRYWLAGGLKPWSLLPEALFPAATSVDRWLSRALPKSSSFVDVEIVRS